MEFSDIVDIEHWYGSNSTSPLSNSNVGLGCIYSIQDDLFGQVALERGLHGWQCLPLDVASALFFCATSNYSIESSYKLAIATVVGYNLSFYPRLEEFNCFVVFRWIFAGNFSLLYVIEAEYISCQNWW